MPYGMGAPHAAKNRWSTSRLLEDVPRADLMRDLIAETTMLEIARKYEAMAARALAEKSFGIVLIDRPRESKSASLEHFGRSGVL